jgi:hypothetical protein
LSKAQLLDVLVLARQKQFLKLDRPHKNRSLPTLRSSAKD